MGTELPPPTFQDATTTVKQLAHETQSYGRLDTLAFRDCALIRSPTMTDEIAKQVRDEVAKLLKGAIEPIQEPATRSGPLQVVGRLWVATMTIIAVAASVSAYIDTHNPIVERRARSLECTETASSASCGPAKAGATGQPAMTAMVAEPAPSVTQAARASTKAETGGQAAAATTMVAEPAATVMPTAPSASSERTPAVLPADAPATTTDVTNCLRYLLMLIAVGGLGGAGYLLYFLGKKNRAFLFSPTEFSPSVHAAMIEADEPEEGGADEEKMGGAEKKAPVETSSEDAKDKPSSGVEEEKGPATKQSGNDDKGSAG